MTENIPNGREKYGAPGEIRTPGLLVRSQALYPTELRARKGREYYHTDKRVPFHRNFALIQARLPVESRRGRDYSALRASPLWGRPNGRYPRFVTPPAS